MQVPGPAFQLSEVRNVTFVFPLTSLPLAQRRVLPACLGGRPPAGRNGLLTADVCPSLNTLSFPEGSSTDRPDASAVHLHDFQRFLLHEQQVREQKGARGAGGSFLDGFSPSHHLPCVFIWPPVVRNSLVSLPSASLLCCLSLWNEDSPTISSFSRRKLRTGKRENFSPWTGRLRPPGRCASPLAPGSA